MKNNKPTAQPSKMPALHRNEFIPNSMYGNALRYRKYPLPNPRLYPGPNVSTKPPVKQPQAAASGGKPSERTPICVARTLNQPRNPFPAKRGQLIICTPSHGSTFTTIRNKDLNSAPSCCFLCLIQERKNEVNELVCKECEFSEFRRTHMKFIKKDAVGDYNVQMMFLQTLDQDGEHFYRRLKQFFAKAVYVKVGERLVGARRTALLGKTKIVRDDGEIPKLTLDLVFDSGNSTLPRIRTPDEQSLVDQDGEEMFAYYTAADMEAFLGSQSHSRKNTLLPSSQSESNNIGHLNSQVFVTRGPDLIRPPSPLTGTLHFGMDHRLGVERQTHEIYSNLRQDIPDRKIYRYSFVKVYPSSSAMTGASDTSEPDDAGAPEFTETHRFVSSHDIYRTSTSGHPPDGVDSIASDSNGFACSESEGDTSSEVEFIQYRSQSFVPTDEKSSSDETLSDKCQIRKSLAAMKLASSPTIKTSTGEPSATESALSGVSDVNSPPSRYPSQESSALEFEDDEPSDTEIPYDLLLVRSSLTTSSLDDDIEYTPDIEPGGQTYRMTHPPLNLYPSEAQPEPLDFDDAHGSETESFSFFTDITDVSDASETEFIIPTDAIGTSDVFDIEIEIPSDYVQRSEFAESEIETSVDQPRPDFSALDMEPTRGSLSVSGISANDFEISNDFPPASEISRTENEIHPECPASMISGLELDSCRFLDIPRYSEIEMETFINPAQSEISGNKVEAPAYSGASGFGVRSSRLSGRPGISGAKNKSIPPALSSQIPSSNINHKRQLSKVLPPPPPPPPISKKSIKLPEHLLKGVFPDRNKPKNVSKRSDKPRKYEYIKKDGTTLVLDEPLALDFSQFE